MEELFQIFATFIQDYQKAMVYLEKRKEQEETNRKRKEAEEARKAAKLEKMEKVHNLTADSKTLQEALSVAKQKKEEPLVDKVVGALTGGSSTQIRKMIQARRRKAGAVRRKAIRADGKEEEEEGEEGEEEEKGEAKAGATEGGGAPIRRTAPSTKVVEAKADVAGAKPDGGGAKEGKPATPKEASAGAEPEKEGKKKKGTEKGGKKKKKVWQKHIDPDSGDAYFYNTKTGASTWEQPPNYPYA
jgi:hypothetical protein